LSKLARKKRASMIRKRRVLDREITRQLKIPKELTEAESLERVRGNMVWRQAREKSDFKMYEPHLVKMIEIKKQIAERVGYEKHPYNALLDMFEEELSLIIENS
jgi:carboxypeptidase Taq